MDRRIQFSIRMLTSVRDQIDRLAQLSNRNRSNYIEAVLLEHINKQDFSEEGQIKMKLQSYEKEKK